MKRWILAALAMAMAAPVSAAPLAARACGPRSHRACSSVRATLNFSAVPDISQQIVRDEPTAAKPVTQTLEAPPITTYTGPMVGVDKMVRAPTVGYYWSLEPDTTGH